MGEGFISRGFRGRHRQGDQSARIPPGQYLEPGFPVLSAGPTPHMAPSAWDFSIVGNVDHPKHWNWHEFHMLPRETLTKDIHCVTKWSKLDTNWEGVSLDTLLSYVNHDGAGYVLAFSDGGYTTNLPLEEVLGGKAWVVDIYEGRPLTPEHGGPARLLVPHLYFWKSAKWVRGLRFIREDEPGFWESLGYNNHGDPWKEERYWGD
jgi:DMSO/TMAO reductase YedYZ molybdopterin-dependent catalytic subunit